MGLDCQAGCWVGLDCQAGCWLGLECQAGCWVGLISGSKCNSVLMASKSVPGENPLTSIFTIVPSGCKSAYDSRVPFDFKALVLRISHIFFYCPTEGWWWWLSPSKDSFLIEYSPGNFHFLSHPGNKQIVMGIRSRQNTHYSHRL